MNIEFGKKKAETICLFIPTVLRDAIIAYLNPKYKPRSYAERR